MKKLLFLCWSLALLLFSCTNAADDALAPTEADGEYVTLTLDTGADAEEKESLRHMDVKLTLDADGKPRVYFSGVVKDGKLVSTVYTMILKGESIIFSQALDWTVEEDGRRLTYRGPIKIKKELLQGEGELRIYANTAVGQPWLQDQSWSRELIGPLTSTGARIPHVMFAPLLQKGKVLHMADATQSEFKAMATLVSFKIKNNLPIRLVTHTLNILHDPDSELYYMGHITYGALGLPGGITYNSRGGEDDQVLLYPGRVIKPGETYTGYYLFSEDHLRAVERFRYIGLGIEADFVKVAGEPGYGKLVEYELDFKPQKHTLDKGALSTDSYGNVLFDGNSKDIAPSRFWFTSSRPEYFHLYGYSQEEAIAKTNTDDAWLARYYLPHFFSLYSLLIAEDGMEMPYNQKYFSSAPIVMKQDGNAYSWNLSPIKSDLSEENVFLDPTNLNRDILKLQRGGPLVESETKFVIRPSVEVKPFTYAFYMMRFLNHPDYRVFQRIRMLNLQDDPLQDDPRSKYDAFKVIRSLAHCEISFLPYDPAGVEGDAALTSEYWAARESQVQKVYIRLPLSTRNFNPLNPSPHIVSPTPSIATESGTFWPDTRSNPVPPSSNFVWWSGVYKSFGVDDMPYGTNSPDNPAYYHTRPHFFIPRFVR